MTKHFLRELENLKRDVTAMGGMAEAAVANATRAFLQHDGELARSVIEGDDEVNALELRIEEECLKLMALYAPTARDLRFVVAVFKITNDLERMGDLAANIAERAKSVVSDGTGPITSELREMSDRVRGMVRQSLDAFVALDSASAKQVLAADDRVDQMLRDAYEEQSHAVDEGQADFKGALRVLSFAKYLERVADHATNIAEDVVYLANGEVVKHQY